ncbi:alpha/beta hydrolase [Pseudomonas sp. NBRC 100443]|uniref:alpha/beta hydrolase n=1 Tax=Pseudomonas sp. NBRC 100443 TaxID=1113665 RepID=UPI0024A195C7|nr:alpha/beta hydrolase [Pseudomonas sp. NBRC 100443]GLU39249.1 lipase [Pseudomonas sp. NBRC 100443]
MSTAQHSALSKVIARVQATYGRWRRHTPIETMRHDWDQLFWSDRLECETQDRSANGVPVRWVRSPSADESRTLIYLHGGGFKMGSLISHHDLMVRLSRAGDCRVLGVDYRLLPEYRFPEPLVDVLAVYDWLLAQGHDPRQMAMAGDSAGGGLAAASLLALRDKGRPLPASAVLLSAWTDLTVSTDSYRNRAELDPIHQQSMLLDLARQYLGEDVDSREPLASPLHGDLAGLPPLLLQVGEREVGFDDSALFAVKVRQAGGEAVLEVWPEMIHVFQQFAEDLPEARLAIEHIGAFLQRHWV